MAVRVFTAKARYRAEIGAFDGGRDYRPYAALAGAPDHRVAVGVELGGIQMNVRVDHPAILPLRLPAPESRKRKTPRV